MSCMSNSMSNSLFLTSYSVSHNRSITTNCLFMNREDSLYKCCSCVCSNSLLLMWVMSAVLCIDADTKQILERIPTKCN